MELARERGQAHMGDDAVDSSAANQSRQTAAKEPSAQPAAVKPLVS